MSLQMNENQVSLKLKDVSDSVRRKGCNNIANALDTRDLKNKTVLVLYVLSYLVLHYRARCEEVLKKYKENMENEIEDENVKGNRYLKENSKLHMLSFENENQFIRSIWDFLPNCLKEIDKCVSVDPSLHEAYFNKTPKSDVDDILNSLSKSSAIFNKTNNKDHILKGIAEYVTLVSGVITKGLPKIIKEIKSMVPSSAEIRLQSARRSVKSLAKGAGSALSTASSKVGHPIKEYAEKAGSNLTSAVDRVGGSIKSVGHSVRRVASDAGDNAKKLGLTVTRRARDAAHNISSNVQSSAAKIRYMGVADSKNWSKGTTLSGSQLSLLKKFSEKDLLACLNASKSFEQKVESMIVLYQSSPFFMEQDILQSVYNRISTFGPHSLLIGLKETLFKTCVDEFNKSPYFLSQHMNNLAMILSADFALRSCASTMCTRIHALAKGIDNVRNEIHGLFDANLAKRPLKPFIEQNIGKLRPSLDALNLSFRNFDQFFKEFKDSDLNSKIYTLQLFCRDKLPDILLLQIDSSITVEGFYNWLGSIYSTVFACERAIRSEKEKWDRAAPAGLPFHKQLDDFLSALYNADFKN